MTNGSGTSRNWITYRVALQESGGTRSGNDVNQESGIVVHIDSSFIEILG